MKIKANIKLYYKDFLIQSVVFYVTSISSIAVLPYYIAGSAGTNSILWSELYYLNKYFSASRLFETILNLFFLMPVYSLVLSAPLSFANIYILRINKYKIDDDDYFATKLLFMLCTGFLLMVYIFVIALGNYHQVLYALFPTLLTSLTYLMLIIYRQHKK